MHKNESSLMPKPVILRASLREGSLHSCRHRSDAQVLRFAQNDNEWALIRGKEVSPSKHNRIARCDAGFAQTLHAVKELSFSLGQNIAGAEHEIHFPQQRWRLFDGKPIAGMSAVINNLLEQNRKLRSGVPLQPPQELAQMLGPGNVAQALGNQIALVLARLLHPPVVRLPLFFGRIPRQGRRPRLVPHEPFGKGMRLRPPIPDTGATYECVEAHSFPFLRGFRLSALRFRKNRANRRVAEAEVRKPGQRTPLGYTRILLASPVFSRSMALGKSFIEIRSVITGCRLSFPLLSSAVI